MDQENPTPTPQKKETRGRKKLVQPEQVIEVPAQKLEDTIHEVSFTKAQKLMKKPREMTEKQKENMQKLIERNKERFAKLREEKAKALEDSKKKDEELKKQQEEAKKEAVLKLKVKPKRVRKPKEKPVVEVQPESEDDSVDSLPPLPTRQSLATAPSGGPLVKKSSVRRRKVVSSESETDLSEVERKVERLNRINKTLNPTKSANPYDDLIKKMF